MARLGFGLYAAPRGSPRVDALADGSDAPFFSSLAQGVAWLAVEANLALLPAAVAAEPAIKAHAAVASGGWMP